MESGLRGKGALVAGASAGIGRAIALGLACEGARVAILARRGLSVDAVRDEWARSPPLRRIGEPSEIAALAVFLASDRAS